MRSSRARHEKIVDGLMNTLDGCTAVIPEFVSVRLLNNHRRVRFKEKNLAVLIESEVDTPIIET